MKTVIYKQMSVMALLLFLFTVNKAFSQGQAPEVKSLEYEIQLGATLPFGSYHEGKANVGPLLGPVELRYNVEDSPFDISLSLGLSTAIWDIPVQKPVIDYDKEEFTGEYTSEMQEQNNRSAYLAIGGNYNFKQGRQCNPFVGLGLGLVYKDVLTGPLDGEGTSPVIIPRFGVELFRHLRFTCASHISRNGWNNVSLAVGVVFGGGLKKNK